MDQKTSGCFAWFRNMKESLTERWTKFKKRHRRDKFENQINVTYLHRLLSRRNEQALLDQFVNELLIKAKSDIDSEIMNIESTLDNISMSSSIISQLADAVVTESLSSLANNINQSADVNGPKTVSEIINTFGIAKESNDDGMPAVSD
ncbi:hypothetical protein ACF0H5_013878 [Mactra antiquata]